MTLKSNAKFEEKLTWGLENDMMNLANFYQSTEKSQTWKMLEFEIYRGFMYHDNEEWCKSWRKTDSSFQNWHKEFDRFWPEHSKVL